MKVLARIFPVFVLVVMTACGSADLTMLNEVKRFEPEWTRLSTTVIAIKTNLKLTERYASDLKEVDPYLSDLNAVSQSDLADMRSRYRGMMSERDSIAAKFGRELIQFEEEVTGFNNWVNDLMKEKEDKPTTQRRFEQYQRKHQATTEVMDDLYARLVRNIELHNSLMRRIAGAVNLYGNYEITVK